MTFKDFWRKATYINRVVVEDIDGNELYNGTGRRLSVKDFKEYFVDSFSVERALLIISVTKKEDAE